MNSDILNIITQLVGIAAMLFSVFSFQMNKHKQIMLMQIVTAILFGTHYFLLGAYTAMALNLVAVVRDVIFYFREDKKWAKSNAWVIIFALLMIVAGAFSWEGYASLLTISGMVVNTLGLSFTKPKHVRMTIFVASPLMLVYNILNHSIGGMINESFVIISVIIGFFRYDITRKNKSE